MVSGYFTFSRSAIYAFLALLIWMALPAGILLIINGETTWGSLLTAAAIAAMVVAVNRGWIKTLLLRRIPKSRAGMMVFGTAASALITASFAVSLIQLSYSPVTLGIAYSTGILLMGAWATIALLRCVRDGGG